MGFTKWILGGIGFALSGTPIGALVGFAVGALVDGVQGGEASTFSGPTPQHRTQTTAGDLALSLVVLTAAVMKADGKATQGELGHVRQFFNRQFGPQHGAELVRLLRDVLQRDIPLADVCAQVRGHLNQAERLQVMHYLMGLAHADGSMDPAERDVLHRIAAYLGITPNDLASLEAMFKRTSTPSAAYAILEVDPKATNEELKKAYRRAAMKHHPDKVAHLGEDVQRASAEKFKKVQDAWDRIQRERGLS
ncbi:MAG TPA: TerB family tellurite resistance protein [Flavobacteriales bacterium]|jgi:DnaJ like chaperone protein|nr:TerB family tellurite resistance protein [Flavobacteriales bacterium]